MTRSVIISLIVSLAIHGILAFALVCYLEMHSLPDTFAQIDLSSVELSLANEVDETAAVLPRQPEVAQNSLSPSFIPPPKSPNLTPQPSDPAAPQLREPHKPHQQFETLPVSSSRPAPQQARVDAPPRPQHTIRPNYPKGARYRGEQGDVILEILVNKLGHVDRVRVFKSSGFLELDQAAIKAATNAKFSPARLGDEAVDSTARLTLSFRLK